MSEKGIKFEKAMKHKILIPISLILLVVTSAFSIKRTQSKKTFTVKNGKVAINKKTITPNWLLSDCKSALGEPSKTKQGYNNTHTYDDLGIVLFESAKDKVGSGIVSEIQYYFSSPPEPNSVTPNGFFTGVVKVDKLTVTSALSATVMLNKLSKWQKTDSYMEHNYRMANSGLYIYFQFNSDETKLIKMSVGISKK